MQEFRDGSTSEIQAEQELVDQLKKRLLPMPEIKAIHFGTEEELLLKKIELRAAAGMPPKQKTLDRLAEIRAIQEPNQSEKP